MTDINLSKFSTQFKQYIDNVRKENKYTEIKVDEKTFTKEICNDKSIFNQIDLNKDGYFTEREFEILQYCDEKGNDIKDGVVTDNERYNAAMKEAEFFAKREVDKWFANDVNRDGFLNNAEDAWSNLRMEVGRIPYTGIDGGLTSAEMAEKFNTNEQLTNRNLDNWMNGTIDDLKKSCLEQYDVELSEADMVYLKKVMIRQANTWLMKTGDAEQSPLYCQCNCTAYTRLVTNNEMVSCCLGNIDKPPIGEQPTLKEGTTDEINENKYTICFKIFSDISKDYQYQKDIDGNYILDENNEPLPVFEKDKDGNLVYDENGELKPLQTANSAEECKNRLAWAMFSESKPAADYAKMTPEEYQKVQQDWQQIRSMKAEDFRAMMLPENKAQRAAFESNSYMSVPQIVQYIDIVESVIGQSWDDENWSITGEQFLVIVDKVNGTYGDDTRLDGKTRADIPENRQQLLRYLEEKGWLLPQFQF